MENESKKIISDAVELGKERGITKSDINDVERKINELVNSRENNDIEK